MNPKEFPWTEDQQVTVTNPTNEAYNFKVHSKEYSLGAGKSARMPGYIAWVYVYGMASQLCQADGNFIRWNEEGYRQEYYERVYSGVDQTVEVIEAEPEPEIQTFDETDLEEPEEEGEPEPEPEEPAEESAKQSGDGRTVEPMKPKAKVKA